MSDHVYYNFEIINNSSKVIVANKTDRRLNALLSNPSDYVLSIVKFSLPTEGISSFINPNEGDYTLTYGSNATLTSFLTINIYELFSHKQSSNKFSI